MKYWIAYLEIKHTANVNITQILYQFVYNLIRGGKARNLSLSGAWIYLNTVDVEFPTRNICGQVKRENLASLDPIFSSFWSLVNNYAG